MYEVFIYTDKRNFWYVDRRFGSQIVQQLSEFDIFSKSGVAVSGNGSHPTKYLRLDNTKLTRYCSLI